MPADRELLERVVRAAFPDADVEHLGTGGFASTFRVRDGEDDLAVKVLDPEKSGSIRSEREERALSSVDHPNVVSYRGTGTQEYEGRTFRYLVMEHIDGKTLDQSMADGDEWPLERVLKLAEELVAGASAIWQAQLAHRDLTPKNIMLREDGSAVIVDLGIARHLDLETVTALPTPGTPGWMAPEQVGLEPAHGDWRSDQFVLGLVLYLLTTGLVPFNAGNLEELWRAPAEQELRPPQAVNPAVPSLVGDVIQQMTAREPYQRFLRAEALAGAITAAAAQLATTGGGTPAASRLVFGVAQGYVKNFAENPFYSDLRAEAVVLDGRCMNADKRQQMAGDAETAGSLRVLDPVNYYDRSPQEARPAGYRDLPYGDAPRRTGFADDADRRAYTETILDYELDTPVDAVISPYFFASRGERAWVQESLELGRVAEQVLADRGSDLPVWTGVAVSGDLLRPGQLTPLLNLLTGSAPTTLYLLVHTGQAPNAPLMEPEMLRGLRTLIDTMAQAGTSVIVGRRFTEGLLLCALGAAGWTTGASGTHQDMQPHPTSAEDEGGGRGLDWFYTPALLNSISLPRRAVIQPQFPQIFAPTTTPGQQVFAQDAARADIGNDTDARIALVRHNFLAMRDQMDVLAGTAPNLRAATLRQWVDVAKSTYNTIGPPWHAAEAPGFLDEWLKVL